MMIAPGVILPQAIMRCNRWVRRERHADPKKTQSVTEAGECQWDSFRAYTGVKEGLAKVVRSADVNKVFRLAVPLIRNPQVSAHPAAPSWAEGTRSPGKKSFRSPCFSQ